MRTPVAKAEPQPKIPAIAADNVVPLFSDSQRDRLAELWETLEPVALRVNTGEGTDAYLRSLEIFSRDEFNQPIHTPTKSDNGNLHALRRQRIGQQLLFVSLQTFVQFFDPRAMHRGRRVDHQHTRDPRLGVFGKFNGAKGIVR